MKAKELKEFLNGIPDETLIAIVGKKPNDYKIVRLIKYRPEKEYYDEDEEERHGVIVFAGI